MAEPEQPAETGAGIIQSLRNLAATLVALLQTRLELLATDLEEERVRLLQLLFLAAGALFCFVLGVLLVTFFVVLLFWDSNRFTAIVVLAAVFFALGIGLALGVRNRMRARPRMFVASLDELAKDREQLTR